MGRGQIHVTHFFTIWDPFYLEWIKRDTSKVNDAKMRKHVIANIFFKNNLSDLLQEKTIMFIVGLFIAPLHLGQRSSSMT